MSNLELCPEDPTLRKLADHEIVRVGDFWEYKERSQDWDPVRIGGGYHLTPPGLTVAQINDMRSAHYVGMLLSFEIDVYRKIDEPTEDHVTQMDTEPTEGRVTQMAPELAEPYKPRKPRIWLDLDGVLVNFADSCCSRLGIPNNGEWAFYEEAGMTPETFNNWLNSQDTAFWEWLEPTPHARELLELVERLSPDFQFLTHAMNTAAMEGKTHWIARIFGDEYVERLVMVQDREDKVAFVEPGDMLIDDNLDTVEACRVKADGYFWCRAYEPNFFRAGLPAYWVTRNHGGVVSRHCTSTVDQATKSVDTLVEVAREAAAAGSSLAASLGEIRVTDPETGGQKNAKPIRIDLIPAEFEEELGRVYHFGCDKYAAHNYRKGYKFSLSIASLYRHLNAWKRGEDNDPESGHSHLAHAAWHCAALFQSQVDHGDRFDDRYKRGGDQNG